MKRIHVIGITFIAGLISGLAITVHAKDNSILAGDPGHVIATSYDSPQKDIVINLEKGKIKGAHHLTMPVHSFKRVIRQSHAKA